MAICAVCKNRVNGKAAELAEAHWEYVGSVIRAEWEALFACGNDTANLDAHLALIGHHFKTAFVHGYKHGVEDEAGVANENLPRMSI